RIDEPAHAASRSSNLVYFGCAELAYVAVIEHADDVDDDAFPFRVRGGHDRADADIRAAVRNEQYLFHRYPLLSLSVILSVLPILRGINQEETILPALRS
ncbi:hypothetical protein, partial [Actinoplanes campanulatus]|uniref:hypothetical protein n=1 Tax=Actinoplanes campanulatus TaxID=113559 RepID=UPI0031D4A965